MDPVVVVHKLGLEVHPGSAHRAGQAGAEGQLGPPKHQAELPAKAAVYPEVEDAVEETVGGREPNHHELNPLRHAAPRDRCGTEHRGCRNARIGRPPETFTSNPRPSHPIL